MQHKSLPTLILILACLVMPCACGGGGGGGSGKSDFAFNGGSWQSDFFLRDVLFGRALTDAAGTAYEVVNPASFVEVDPITGFLLPGYPKTLFPNDELGNLWSFNLMNTFNQPYEPKIVPRNAALVVIFSQPVNPDSLKLDANMTLTADSPISIEDAHGGRVPAQVTILGDRLILNPVLEDQVGFPASTLIFDEGGSPIGNPEGDLRLVCYSMGTANSVLESASGLELGARADELGTPAFPAGFNPGNSYLDFLSFGDLTFNGFLPDLTPPRIIREVRTGEGVDIDGVAYDPGYVVITDDDADFNVTANGGSGEWAGAVLTLRPGETWETKVRVVSNTRTDLYVAEYDPGFTFGYPEIGDAYLAQRAEYFEPIDNFGRPETAIDPDNHPRDLNDPEDAFNSELIRFLTFDRWNGSEWEPVDGYDYNDPEAPIEPRYRIGVQFSEPMDISSIRPYENFYLATDTGLITDPLFRSMKLGRITAERTNTKVYFEPVQIDKLGLLGGDQFRGLGREPALLRFVIRTLPPPHLVEAFYDSLGDPALWPPEVIGNLDAHGVLGVMDLGGQPLGIPDEFLDKADPYCVLSSASPGRGAFPPAVDFVVSMTNVGDPTLEEWGAVVHRFMGKPETAADVTVEPPVTGVVFRDHDDGDGGHEDNEIYGPHIAEVNLNLSGFLSGHSVAFIEHVFDEHNPPPPSAPTYPDPVNKMAFGTGTPINARNGVKFQHMFRRGEVSPDVPTFQGTILDLIGMAWVPIGGNVSQTYIKEMAIAMAYSQRDVDVWDGRTESYYDEPDTRQDGSGIPRHKESGMKRKFDSLNGEWGPYREQDPPINKTNVYDADFDQSLRDEWTIVVGDPIDFDALGSDPVRPYTGGRPYFIDQKNRIVPKNQGSKFNYFLPYPEFNGPEENPGFGYDSSRGLLIEIRINDNESTPVAISNGYAFHVAILSSYMPRFRTYCRANVTTLPVPPFAPHRTSMYPASDPWDLVNPPLLPNGEVDVANTYIKAWEDMLPFSLYGDNSRYLMLFKFAKRISTIVSPFIQVEPVNVKDPHYSYPIVELSQDQLPPGTELTLWVRPSLDGSGAGLTEQHWAPIDQIDLLSGFELPFIQFKATFESNIQTGATPAIDTFIIPYRIDG